MIAEDQDQGLDAAKACFENVVDERNDTLRSSECAPRQHQNDNNSNLNMGLNHHDLSLQPQIHRHLSNGNTSSVDTSHIAGTDLLRQHFLAQNALNSLQETWLENDGGTNKETFGRRS